VDYNQHVINIASVHCATVRVDCHQANSRNTLRQLTTAPMFSQKAEASDCNGWWVKRWWWWLSELTIIRFVISRTKKRTSRPSIRVTKVASTTDWL